MGWVMPIRIRTVCVLVLLCLTTILASHPVSGETPAPEARTGIKPNRQTPNDLLRFYEAAHETKNIEMYEEALHDLFRLEMDSENTRRQNLTPEEAWIGKARAVVATRRMFEYLKAIGIKLIPITEWEACMEVRITHSGKRDSLVGLRITVDPLIQYHLYGPAGVDRVRNGSHTWFHMTVVPDPRLPDSWVIIRIKDEVEAH